MSDTIVATQRPDIWTAKLYELDCDQFHLVTQPETCRHHLLVDDTPYNWLVFDPRDGELFQWASYQNRDTPNDRLLTLPNSRDADLCSHEAMFRGLFDQVVMGSRYRHLSPSQITAIWDQQDHPMDHYLVAVQGIQSALDGPFVGIDGHLDRHLFTIDDLKEECGESVSMWIDPCQDPRHIEADVTDEGHALILHDPPPEDTRIEVEWEHVPTSRS